MKGKVVKLDTLSSSEFNRDLTDEEVESLLDSFCDYISQGLIPKDGDIAVLDPQAMKQFATVYNVVKSSIKNKGVKITYGINEPYVGSGFIRIEGTKIEITNTKVFSKAAKLASNFEVYPLVNGKLRMAFAFSGLVLR